MRVPQCAHAVPSDARCYRIKLFAAGHCGSLAESCAVRILQSMSDSPDCNSFGEEAARGAILLRRGDAHGLGMFLAEGAYGRHPQLQRLSGAAQRYPGNSSKSGISGRPNVTEFLPATAKLIKELKVDFDNNGVVAVVLAYASDGDGVATRVTNFANVQGDSHRWPCFLPDGKHF